MNYDFLFYSYASNKVLDKINADDKINAAQKLKFVYHYVVSCTGGNNQLPPVHKLIFNFTTIIVASSTLTIFTDKESLHRYDL